MKGLDLFSGIGGLALAAERAGVEARAFVEIDGYCRRVLRRHWPDAPIYEDIREFSPSETYDIVYGGFPCQGLSQANKFANGLDDLRSGLFREFLRVAVAAKSRWLVFENSDRLIRNPGYWAGFKAECNRAGFAVDGGVVTNPSFHRRNRAFAVAYPDSLGGKEKVQQAVSLTLDGKWDCEGSMEGQHGVHVIRRAGADPLFLAGNDRGRLAFPVFSRTNDGIPNRLERCRALGNAVDPRQFERVFRAVMQVERGGQ